MLGIFAGDLEDIRLYETSDSDTDFSSIDFDGYISSIKEVYESINLSPIKDIYLVNTNETCSSDSKLDLYQWSTSTLCNCPYSSKLTMGKCESDMYNCYTTSSRSITLNIWRGKMFCVSRYTTGTWMTKGQSETCPDTYLTCGQKVCVKKSGRESEDVCPISKLFVGTNETLPTISDLYNNKTNKTNISRRYLENQTFVIPNGFYLKANFSDSFNSQLYLSRNVQDPPIINLKASANGFPCIFNLEENKRVSNFQFLKASPNGCSKYSSDKNSFSLVDRKYEWDFYVDNNLLKITSDLLNMKNYILDITELYSQTWISNSCHKNLDIIIQKETTNTQNLIDSRRGSDVIGLIIIIIAIIMWFVNIIYCFMKKRIIDSFNLTIWITIFIIIEEVICPISLNYINKIENNNSFLYDIGLSECFDIESYNNLFSDLRYGILVNTQKFKNMTLTILYFSMLMFIINILYFLDKLRWNYFFEEDQKGPLENVKFKNVCDEDDCDCEGCLI